MVQSAFAGPDLEEEFISYKKQLISDELGFDEKRKDVLKKGKHFQRLSIWFVNLVNYYCSESGLGRLGNTWQFKYGEC